MKPTFHGPLAAEPGPLVMPGAHDAISARLIARAGFKAHVIGGFPLVGARYGLPDVGPAALGEIAAGVRDIVAAFDRHPRPKRRRAASRCSMHASMARVMLRRLAR